MDVLNDRPMEPDTSFLMASSGKPLYAAAAMVLVDEGLISLEEAVSKYIPEFAEIRVAVPLNRVKTFTRKAKAGAKQRIIIVLFLLISPSRFIICSHILRGFHGSVWTH